MSIGERIKQLREMLELTQTEFADRIGLTYKMLGLYERGVYEPSEKVLKLISFTFGVPYEWLKEGEREWFPKNPAAIEMAGYKTVGERIRLIRKALGLTQAEFGKQIGRAWNTINRWEAGEREIPDMALKLISEVFGVSYKWLKTGQGEIIEREQRKLLESKIKVPVVGKAGAGFPHSPSDIEVIGVVFVGKGPHIKEGKTFAVQVYENSMYPTLTGGDYVVFRIYDGKGSDIPNGKIVVVKDHSGELLVKRLLKVEDAILLASDNYKYPPIFLQQVEAELRVVGVAVKIVKELEA